MRDLFGRLDRALAFLERGFIATCLLLGCVLLFVNVIFRYFLSMPISWAEEASLYLCVWLVFVGASIAVRERGHIAIDLLPQVLSPAARIRLAQAVAVVMLVFFAVFFFYSLQHVLRVKSSGQTTPIMQAPMWLTYLAMPVGSFLMGMRVIQVFFVASRDSSIARGAELSEMKD